MSTLKNQYFTAFYYANTRATKEKFRKNLKNSNRWVGVGSSSWANSKWANSKKCLTSIVLIL